MAAKKKTPMHDDEMQDKALIKKMIKDHCAPKKKPAKKSKKSK